MTKAKVNRILVTHKSYKMVRQVLANRQIYFIAGLNSIYVPSRNEKYVVTHNHLGNPICREWPDLDGEMVMMPPGEAARTELKREFPDLKKVGWVGRHITLFDWRSPAYFFGPYRGEAVYVDMVSAYHQIYRRLWLDVGFTRGFGSLDLLPLANRLEIWKGARNAIMGIVRSRISYGWRGNSVIRLSIGNSFLSPHLWATVQSILNEVAFQALQCGCLYCATDGFIFPMSGKFREFVSFLDDFGFRYRKESGDCRIIGWGNYRVGDKMTKRHLQIAVQGSRPFKSLSLVSQNDNLLLTRWWAKEVTKWRISRTNIEN
jgi:hypothetical protein